jgi:hypothetical protein
VEVRQVLQSTKKRLHSAPGYGRPNSKPGAQKKQKIIFADFSELDCHRDPTSGQVNFKELEMCRYLEHRARREKKQQSKMQRQDQQEEKLQKIVSNGLFLQNILVARWQLMNSSKVGGGGYPQPVGLEVKPQGQSREGLLQFNETQKLLDV